jgi:heat shock protein HslJ
MKSNLAYTTFHAVIVMAFLGSGCYSVPSEALMVVAPSSLAPPVGTTWVATEVDGIVANATPPADLAFESDRRIGGSSGCNRYVAEFQGSEPSVRVGSVGGTLRTCEPPLMEQEHRFINALEFTTTFHVEGDTMLFKDRRGRVLICFRRMNGTGIR